ncbi:bifunctional adenosylcobinamide kinase/adenosylcobinamide-phosphate guanylyltransferase [Kushneria indalinina]|uniref:Bifunctional adenosylcobalamin biosynthesis protein n=1 Tax=Kushneria indalinina DSM 14324 TaxID=1122140 RepID=A0A3D9DZL8_9GAMM|nr:bifunctional adenosylcobinamide kinase/adenosylcobinamide-phosphate guanylyltransferase [Kushneria indalinina]REC96161.1 adenosylcobinamide kinase /adenosylcobinamide-phosphate guanylyltransferase [Kushneria indalinina DSM 14324]
MHELILGGARSGKSAHGERLAAQSDGEVTYIATAQVHDDSEMYTRIKAHQARRPAHWALVEAPLALGDAIACHARPDRLLLVDCLTLWLTNLLLEGEERFVQERARLLEALSAAPGRVLMVSNEVGQGVVPMNALSRRFVDEAGRLHQALAEHCQRVWWVVAGLPQCLKGDRA